VMPDDGYWLPAYLTYNATALEGESLSDRGRKAGQASALARSAGTVAGLLWCGVR